MPLSEQRRRQLDEIVVKMANQNAPKEDVVAIVNDFKQKYENEGALPPVVPVQPAVLPPAQPKEEDGGIMGTASNFVVGAGKYVADLPRKAAELGQNLADYAGTTKIGQAAGQGIRNTLGKVVSPQTAQSLQQGLKQGSEQIDFIKPVGDAQKAGNFVAELGSYFVPVAGEAKLTAKAAQLAKGIKGIEGAGILAKGTGALAKVTGGLVKTVPSAIRGASQASLNEGSTENFVKNAALVPLSVGAGKVVGGIVKKGLKGIQKGISPGIEDSLMRAIKPAKNNTGFVDALKTSLPDLQETAQISGKKIQNIDDLEQAITETKKRVWANYADLLGPNANATVDGNKIADAMVSSLDKRFIAQNPEKVKGIIAKADTYRHDITLNDAEEALQSVNNDLHAYYAKNKVAQNVAAQDPEFAYVVNEGEALRKQLYAKLDELTGEQSAELKKRYGALSNLQKEVTPRKNVIARQNPLTLAEQVGYARAGGNVLKNLADFKFGSAVGSAIEFAVPKGIKKLNDPNFLIEKAFSTLEKNPRVPYAPTIPNRFVPAGYLEESKTIIPQYRSPVDTSGILPQSSAAVPRAQGAEYYSPKLKALPSPAIIPEYIPRNNSPKFDFRSSNKTAHLLPSGDGVIQGQSPNYYSAKKINDLPKIIEGEVVRTKSKKLPPNIPMTNQSSFVLPKNDLEIKKKILNSPLPQGINKKIELTTSYDTPHSFAQAELESNILTELSLAKAGKRTYIPADREAAYGTQGSTRQFGVEHSTFPKWIPEGLRKKHLLEAVQKHIQDGTFPQGSAQKDLYNVVAERMGFTSEATKKVQQDLKVLDIDFGQDTEKSIKTIDNLSSQYEQRIRDLESQTRLP